MTMHNLWSTSVLIEDVDDDLISDTINFLLTNKNELSGKEAYDDSILELSELSTIKSKIFVPAFDKYLKQTLNKNLSDWAGNRINGWLVAYDQGRSLNYHNHRGSQLSAVLYLICDETDMGGEIVFTDPRQNANRGYDSKFQEWFTPLKVRPKCGQLVVFPSFLYHYVTTYQSNIRLALPADCFLYG